MKTCAALFWALSTALWANDFAIIRQNTNNKDFTVTVRITRTDPDLSKPLGVNLVRSTDVADEIDLHWDVDPSAIRKTVHDDSTDFIFTLPVSADKYKSAETYVLAIPLIPSSQGPWTRAEIPLSGGLEGDIVSDVSNGFCPAGVLVTLKGGNLAEADWTMIDDFFRQRESTPNQDFTLRIGTAGQYVVMPIRTLVRTTRSLAPILLGGTYSVCINTVHQLPKGAFNAILDFQNGAPPSLKFLSPIAASDLDGRQSPSLKDASAPPGNVGDRALERNLDLGVAYTQSRNTKTGESTRLGVLDMRLAPLLDIQQRIGKAYLSQSSISSWHWFLTPIFIDTNIATGSITENTVSLNRIAFGPQFEFRYMKLRSSPGDPTSSSGLVPIPRYPNVHRLILAGNHYSDRDFKQREYVAKLEYQPLLGAWNRRRDTRWKSVSDPVTKTAVVLSPVGWTVIPRFGTEIGNTYHRRNPADAVIASDFVRRGYGGLDINLEITDYLSFSMTDTLYIRGEIAGTHLVNYLKVEADFPVGSLLRETSQSFFISYERGSLPPFDKLNAKALRGGYRIRSENWLGFKR